MDFLLIPEWIDRHMVLMSALAVVVLVVTEAVKLVEEWIRQRHWAAIETLRLEREHQWRAMSMLVEQSRILTEARRQHGQDR